jgi:hypothetical protein
MLSSTLSSSILLLASSVFVDAAGYATRDSQYPTCSGFDTSSNDTRPFPSRDFIISTGVVCNVNGSNFSTPCDVLSGGWPTLQNVFLGANGSVLASGSTRLEDSLAWTIWNTTGDTNPYSFSRIVAVENETVTFDNGTSGYGKLRLPYGDKPLWSSSVLLLITQPSHLHAHIPLCDRSHPRLPFQLYTSQQH